MTALARKLLEMTPDRVTRLTYGTMASATTVRIDGATTAVAVPKLDSVGALSANDYVALLVSGADALIIGQIS